MSVHLIPLLGLIHVIVGCTARPFNDQEEPDAIPVNNSANTTHAFEVSVAEVPANVTTHRDEAHTGNYRIGQEGHTYSPGNNHTWTAVELLDSAWLHGRYTLEPGEMNRSEIQEFPSDFAVYVVIYQDDHVVSRVSAHCDGDLVFLEVTMFYYGSGSAYSCEGGLF